VASLYQGRTAAAQCGLFTHKSVPVIHEPPCTLRTNIQFLPRREHTFSIRKTIRGMLHTEIILT